MEWQFLFLFVSVKYISATYYVYPPVEANDTVDHLYFTLIMSFGGAFNSSGTIPGIQVALDHINEDPNIIQGYKLHYILSDSQVRFRECVLIYIVLFLKSIELL